MSKLLVESTATATPTATPGRWRATLLTPGRGTSGYYSEAMLKEYGPTALKKGAKCFVTHNRLANGEPDPFSLWGVLSEDASYEDGVGLVGTIDVLPSWRDKIEEIAPHTGLSVYVAGEVDADENVTALEADTQNGVDLVVYPGRAGSALVEKLYEAMKTSPGIPGENGEAPAEAAIIESEHKMDEAQIKALFEAALAPVVEKVTAIETFVSGLVALQESAAAAAKGVEDAFEVVEEITVAIGESEIPAEGRKRIIESVKGGASVADAVKTENEYIKAIRETAPSDGGFAAGRAVPAGAKSGFSLSKLSEVGR